MNEWSDNDSFCRLVLILLSSPWSYIITNLFQSFLRSCPLRHRLWDRFVCRKFIRECLRDQHPMGGKEVGLGRGRSPTRNNERQVTVKQEPCWACLVPPWHQGGGPLHPVSISPCLETGPRERLFLGERLRAFPGEWLGWEPSAINTPSSWERGISVLRGRSGQCSTVSTLAHPLCCLD